MIVILGCGYTGRRVARIMAAAGHRVLATQHRADLAIPGVESIHFDASDPALVSRLAQSIPSNARLLHSIPLVSAAPLDSGAPSAPVPPTLRPTPMLAPVLERAERVVYLSTTGVYGAQHIVDETTAPAPRIARERMRVEEELQIAAACPSTLILRPAAIYGPGRGVHVSLRQGRHKLWGDGSNVISRIHVDDLAAIAAAALASDLTGAFPVADDDPCAAIEITRFCADLLGIHPPKPMGTLPPEDTRSANRHVDGQAIRRLLGVELRYPGYRQGVPAAIAAESNPL
ncbi:MAG: NAD-dependent epimerase/dehydratase family protein [Bryobacteraceae bacterium]